MLQTRITYKQFGMPQAEVTYEEYLQAARIRTREAWRNVKKGIFSIIISTTGLLLVIFSK